VEEGLGDESMMAMMIGPLGLELKFIGSGTDVRTGDVMGGTCSLVPYQPTMVVLARWPTHQANPRFAANA
jgi:hypothetical protein